MLSVLGFLDAEPETGILFKGFWGRIHSGKSECGQQGGGDAKEECGLTGEELHSDPEGSSGLKIAGQICPTLGQGC